MQLIWVSGPTQRVLTWSITRRKVMAALALTAGTLLLLGGLFQWIGLRIAIELVPSFAHRMGGVTSHQEQQRMEASYQAQLEKLQRQLALTAGRLQDLESSRQALLERIGLGALVQPPSPDAAAKGGRGGPWRMPAWWQADHGPLSDRLSHTSGVLDGVQRSVEQTHQRWKREQARLEMLPLALPLQTDFSLSSGFGIRLDPLTHLPAMHEGLDFVAPVGTPVVVTAAGEVALARYSGAYGNMVEVVHAEGFVTRYAHLQSLLVAPGDRLRAGDRVGLLGNTGRSSGPHLHYEVLYRGQAMHPVKALQTWSRS